VTLPTTIPALEARVRAVEEAVGAEYEACTPASRVHADRARCSLAGGVSGNLRHYAPYPIACTDGTGPYVRDLDGRTYVDCFLGNGPLLLGHRPPELAGADTAWRRHGSLVLNPELGVEVAEALVRAVPCAERVRFLNSGTEAVLTAVRCARAATGRPTVIRCFGHYHGQDDQFLSGVSSRNSQAFGAGVSAPTDMLLVDHGDLEAVESALAGGEVAGVLLDPAMHAGGLWGSDPDTLQRLRASTERHGALLIFDEVITGFRLGLGGAQEYYGVQPDLATYAKALAAGERLGAVAGSTAAMAPLSLEQDASAIAAFQSGTGNDGTIGLAAGLAALTAYGERARTGGYERLFADTRRLADGLERVFGEQGIPCRVHRLGPMLQIVLGDPVGDFAALSDLDQRPLHLFNLAMVSAGVLIFPTSGHLYLSFAHGAREIDLVLERAQGVLERHPFHTLFNA
jgi:glutamate-1-semialdehyde 2,1-aminomutase